MAPRRHAWGVREIASPETVKKASGFAEPAGADATPDLGNLGALPTVPS